MRISKIRDFSRDYDFSGFSIVRVLNPQVRALGGRHGWVKIQNGKHVIFRRVRGAGGSLGLTSDSIEIDYDSRLTLNINSPRDEYGFHSCDLEVLPTTPAERLLAHWNHPDPGYRTAFQLAIVGVGLGGIGLGLGVISLFLGVVSLGLAVIE